MMNQQKVAIVGASGYSGEELIRLLSRHPAATLTAITSRQFAGQLLGSIYPKFSGLDCATLPFIDSDAAAIAATGATIAFLAVPHGVAKDYAGPLLNAGLRVLDLSADFRIKDIATYEEFYGEKHTAPDLAKESVYGLPEIYRSQIRDARLIACAGCYPTSILLPLLPLVKKGLLDLSSIAVSSMSGVSGAGRTVKTDYLFAECNESARAYGLPKHRHLAEVEQELSIAAARKVTISFTPHLIPVTRGIHTTIYAQPAPGTTFEEIDFTLRSTYENERFVRVLTGSGLPDTKNVTQTNFIDLAARHDARTGRVILLSAEDNLIKGASGQAVQCLNILAGWPEETGLL